MERLATVLAGVIVVTGAGCSGGSSDSPSGVPGVDADTRPPIGEIEAPTSGEVDTSLYPSNEEIAAVGGTVDEEQALALLPGTWDHVDPATDCTTTYVFDAQRLFSLSSLDQRAAGMYDIDDFNGGITLEEQYTADNFGSDCRGFVNDSDALEVGVSFDSGLEFVDQDTMILDRGRDERFERR